MRVCDQHQVDLRQVLDFTAGALQALHEKNPVPKIGIDQQVQIGELAKKGGMPDPSDGNLTIHQLRVCRCVTPAGTGREPPFPDHLVKKGARIEMIAWGEFFERPGNTALTPVALWSMLRIHRIFYQRRSSELLLNNLASTPSKPTEQKKKEI